MPSPLEFLVHVSRWWRGISEVLMDWEERMQRSSRTGATSDSSDPEQTWEELSHRAEWLDNNHPPLGYWSAATVRGGAVDRGFCGL